MESTLYKEMLTKVAEDESLVLEDDGRTVVELDGTGVEKLASAIDGLSQGSVNVDQDVARTLLVSLEKVGALKSFEKGEAMNPTVKDLLKIASSSLVELQRQKEYLVSELATRMHSDSAEKVAKRLADEGILDDPTPERVSQVAEKVASLKDLGAAEQLIPLLKPGSGLAIGEPQEKTAAGIDNGTESKVMDDPACALLLGKL